MQLFETYISNLLRRFPKIRNNIRLVYQSVFIICLKILKLSSKSNDKAVEVTSKDNEFFFGYYDKSPWNRDGSLILLLEVYDSKVHPSKGEKAFINVVDINNYNKCTKIFETNVWNLQQGCMMQWLGPNFKSDIIFNDCINNKYCSIIYNLQSQKTKILDKPIYSVSKDGKYAVSLNFSRLHRLRPGYGYANLPDETKDDPHPKDDGIWYVDLEKNQSKLIISLEDITKINWDCTMEKAQHKFNHLEINPDGTRFSFLHRWQNKKGKFSRLYTANLDGSEIFCLADDGMVSHSCWKNGAEILCWCRKKGIGDRYFLFLDKTSQFSIIGDEVLNQDGHPSYSPDGRYILTDTYPDRTRHRTLIIFDTQENKRHDIAKFFAPFKYDGEVRCDLHPRWNRDGSEICIDSVHEGKRKMYIIKNPLFKG